jgi:hypothetical protein
MRYAIATAVLFLSFAAASQPPSPSSGEHPGANQKQAADEASKSKGNSAAPQKPPPSLNLNDPPITSRESNNSEEKPNQTASKQWWKDPNWVIAVLTFVLAVAAIAQFAAAFLQVCVYRRQAKIMRTQTGISVRQARAYVFLSEFVVELTTADNVSFEGDSSFTDLLPAGTDKSLCVTRFAVIPSWKNEGSTPTKNMRINISFRGPDGSLPPDFPYKYGGDSQPFFLAPKASAFSEPLQIPAGHVNAIIANVNAGFGGVPKMFIWGRADYFDVFDKPHFVEWCFRIRFDRHDGKNLMVRFLHYGEHNRSDESA